ncbi:FecR family protein [Chitinophaga deserti]|uniref:FecR family protein n=1 Tax=Chitinophaga deserti TaxID=2164099 RepID=UPI000D6B65B0|nr:FecR family protein [Chitinophaga deserti]
MNQQTLTTLIDRYLNGTATAAEKQLLEAYYDTMKQQAAPVPDAETEEAMRVAMLAKVFENAGIPAPVETPVRRLWVRRAAAAAAIVVMSGAAWWMLQPEKPRVAANIKQQPVPQPGKDVATLTLANGQVVVLDDSTGAIPANQGGAQIALGGDALTYNDEGTADAAPVYNTLKTPAGGKFRLTLSDGTKVWLNAASSIRYPARFTDGERKVTVTGEAYFEVTGSEQQPFVVDVHNKATVRVLGTAFNVQAYTEDARIVTTLVSGKVQFATGGTPVTLRPAQQAVAGEDGQIAVQSADTEIATAWKDGYFRFRGTDIKTIMRQLERWYNIETEYQGDIQHLFVADIPRDAQLEEILKLLEMTNRVHFVTNGRQVTVKP